MLRQRSFLICHLADFLTLTAPSLPRTRSGKIVRRALRKIASGEADQLGDLSTIQDPSVIDQLVKRMEESNKAAK